MTTISLPRLCTREIPALRLDGSTMNLAHPLPCEVDFNHVASSLSKISRFTGRHEGPAYSVAQHSVMGAEAMLREGQDEFTASLFLLHDAHEYLLGDQSRPDFDATFAALSERSTLAADLYREVIALKKSGWDEAIYLAADRPAPYTWTKKQSAAVKSMDDRMMAAEAHALIGAETRRLYPVSKYPLPGKFGDKAFKVWGSGDAEMKFIECFDRLIGQKQRETATNNHQMHRKGKRS